MIIPAKDMQVGDVVRREPTSDFLVMETNPPAPLPWERIEWLEVVGDRVRVRFTPCGETKRDGTPVFSPAHVYPVGEIVTLARRVGALEVLWTGVPTWFLGTPISSRCRKRA